MARLFLGVGLTDEVRRALAAHLREALGEHGLPGRAVPAGNWHLTLRFLGDVSPEQLERLRLELQRHPLGTALEVGFGRCGAFPRPARATVLWLGVEEGTEPLRALAAEVEEAVRGAGFAPEQRPFKPHLTLSRIQPPRDVRPLLDGVPPFPARLPVTEVILFQSHLGGGPARYEALERFHLH